jgi:hypothetical protein
VAINAHPRAKHDNRLQSLPPAVPFPNGQLSIIGGSVWCKGEEGGGHGLLSAAACTVSAIDATHDEVISKLIVITMTGT